MTLVRKIRALDVPIIVLSATLTPSLVPEFLTAIDMIGPTTIRSGADGPNLQYSVSHAHRHMEVVYSTAQIIKRDIRGVNRTWNRTGARYATCRGSRTASGWQSYCNVPSTTARWSPVPELER